MRIGNEACELKIDPDAFASLNLHKLNLSGNSLSMVPTFPSTLKYLNLNYNHILNMDGSTFAGLVNLKYLYMEKNCFYRNPCDIPLNIENTTFSELQRLELLSLNNNELVHIPSNLPRSLKKLLLSQNKITSISKVDLNYLRRLKMLDIGGNCRRCDHASTPCIFCPAGTLNLNPASFSKLHSLEKLMLNDNSLTQLDENLFKPLKQLRWLDLSNNYLTTEIYNGTVFRQLSRVETLTLSYNYRMKVILDRLSFSESFANMHSLKQLYLSGIFFRSLDEKAFQPLLQLHHLVRVNLNLNFIDKIPLHLFGRMSSLHYIGLAENEINFPHYEDCSHKNESYRGEPLSSQPNGQLLSVEKGMGLDLSEINDDEVRNSKVGKIKEAPWYSAIKPSCNLTLDLQKNNLVFIKPDMFKELERVECLKLSFNSISQPVNGSQFTNLVNVKHLDLSHNRIDLYYGSAFRELPNLEHLDLSSNSYHFSLKGLGHQLTFIRRMHSLRYLSLANNKIADRITKMLESDSLNFLDFSRNRLDIMWQPGRNMYIMFFHRLTNLTLLDISRNFLKQIPAKALDYFPRMLRALFINNNHLTSFNWTQLSNFKNLEILDLRGNYLTILAKSPSIPSASIIHKLDLSDNRIYKIYRQFFDKAHRLTHLNLSHNSLQTIDEISIPYRLLKELKNLDIRGNPMLCTCDSTFYEFIFKFNISIPQVTNKVTCGSPNMFKGRSIFSRDVLLCSDELSPCLFALSFLTAFALMLLPIGKQFWGWDVWYTFYICSARFGGSVKDHGAESSDYDAFVIFDKEQANVADWVYNELRAHLEDKGIRKFKLCLEERDWVPGKTSIENLCNAVYKSKKTIFILSKYQPMNGMLRETFFMAQQRLLEEKKDVVILILLDEVLKKSRYLQLRKRLCKKTVLFWPPNPFGQQYFWHKLRTVLDKDNHQYYDKNFSVGFDASAGVARRASKLL
ncbi:toll-like receptor 9 [Latimeria chalumnae]|uniref:toll-like receptor 9 n=1 Tax=Latimeria chalumnae TaxID=7897 RepID=UPI0003C144E2|nr:PREDICTED: toll-like receptor 9 [Latimeria chalumnae]|eukprot:XP_005987154.1 PREDICTED: toll-like receptor 9 [Latimeria chalumnae]